MWDNTKNAHVYVNVIQFYYFRYFHCKSYQSKIKAETTVNIFWENGMKFAEFAWKIAEFNDAMSVNFSNKKKSTFSGQNLLSKNLNSLDTEN